MAGFDAIPQAAEEAGVSMTPHRTGVAILACIILGAVVYALIILALGMSSAPGVIEANRIIQRNPAGPTAEEKLWRSEMIEQTLGDSFLQRMGTAGKVADAVAFLAGDDASCITGQVLYVSGGGIG